ncbi:MAG: hypothetical protein KAR17_10025 [Cyclobacteriaceae bacterium]|nr:hypothetical protein [Cyclobacteriaceae bacterium]
MSKVIKNIFLFVGITMVFWHCSETKDLDPEILGSNFFPLKTGTYKVYQVHGIRYNSFIDSTEFEYLLKESVLDSFQNLEFGISFKIQRLKKYNDNDPWVIDSIWTARKDDRTAIMVENNVPIVNLTFPLKENKTWDGNKLNGNSEDEFQMINVNKQYADSFGSYENTVTVIQEDLADIIVRTISKKEIYSENTGLVYKENIILNYKQDEFIGLGIIDNGLKYFQHLVEYGEE